MKILAVGDFQGKFPENLKRRLGKEEFDIIIGVGDYGGISEWRPWVMKNLSDAKKGKPYLTALEHFGEKKLKMILKKDEDATKNVFKKLNSFRKPFISIFGNGDDGWFKYPFSEKNPVVKRSLVKFLSNLKYFKDITYDNTIYYNINFVGFGGYMDIEAYMDQKVFPEAADKEKFLIRRSRLDKSRENLFSRLKKIREDRVFVFHYPPLGIFDIISDKKDNPMNGRSAGVRFFREAILKYKPKLVLCGHMHEYQGIKELNGIPVINPGDAEKGKYAIIDYPEDGKGKIKVRFVR